MNTSFLVATTLELVDVDSACHFGTAEIRAVPDHTVAAGRDFAGVEVLNQPPAHVVNCQRDFAGFRYVKRNRGAGRLNGFGVVLIEVLSYQIHFLNHAETLYFQPVKVNTA